jgi:hypothetical protein
MYHTLEKIADSNFLDHEKFKAFANSPEGEQYLTDDHGTTTWYTNDLVKAYKTFRGVAMEQEYKDNFDRLRKLYGYS